MKSIWKIVLSNGALTAIRQSATAVFAWLLGCPLTYLFKRDPNWITVIGRQGRVFADNSKYFFIAANQYAKANERIVFLTNDRYIRDAVTSAGGIAILHPSWRSFHLLLRCGTVVTDMAEWFDFGAYQLSHGARRVQIWHGAPLKRIELDVFRERVADTPIGFQALLQLQKRLIGRYPVYDTVVSTSENFSDHAFKKCFAAKQFSAIGYPRNDILQDQSDLTPVCEALLKVNVDDNALKAVERAKAKGQWVCLYVPTFRKDMADPFSGPMDLSRFSEFAVNQNVLVVLKLHPLMQGRYAIGEYPNLLEYEPYCDIYPLMAKSDMLITDYSSIFFDFLLLDRPVVFFAPDLEDYLKNDRDMYFDYDAMTPGPKCYCYAELEQKLKDIIHNDGNDGYAEMRGMVRKYTHDFIDNQAGNRLFNLIRHSP